MRYRGIMPSLLGGTGTFVPSVPSAPTIGLALSRNVSADVAFTPNSDGGSPITSYTATSSPGGFTATGGSSPLTVTGLSNGTAYTFTVKATNAIGDSSASGASNSVTPATDANYANVKSLLHFDGANASTVFTDMSGKIWTPQGNAQLDTSQFKFGPSSYVGDGTGDCITTPDHADWNLSADFTIEMFIRPQNVADTNRDLIAKRASSANFGSFAIIMSANNITFYCSSNGSAWDIASAQLLNTFAVSALNWHHIAVTRSGNTWSGYYDSNRGFTFSSALSPVVNAVTPSIGATADGSGSLHGWIDNVRITKGTARYTGATYTVPTTDFANG